MKKIGLIALAATMLWAQGGPPPGGGGTTTSVTYYATYKLDGGSATQSSASYTATAADTSAVWVTNSGSLILQNPTLSTSGNTSSQDSSSFYGLNAGLLVTSAGSAKVTGGSIVTRGTGANCAFATGTGSSVTLTDTSLDCSADGGHGVMATLGGTLTLNNVKIVTAGQSSAAVATDRGGGSITATGGTWTTSGNNSPGIYSTGNITITGATIEATGSESAVIEGANSITLTDTSLSSTKEKWGVMIYQSMSGDANGTRGVFTMTGGSLRYTPTAGPLFYVTNSTAIVTLKGVSISSGSSVLVKAAAGNWGNSGSNGGTAVFTADAQTLTGDLVADSISSIDFTLKNGSSLTGTVTRGALTLDSGSVWSVAGNSTLTKLDDSAAVSGTGITNIRGNGYTVTYDSGLAANSYLGGKTYTLANGGTLKPASGSSSSTPSISYVVNSASFAAGVAPATWITILGANLAASTASAGTADLVNGSLPTTLAGASVMVNGKSAYLNYASPTQINLESPADTGTGDVNISVTTAAGTASATARMQSVMPSLFAASGYALAWRPSDNALLGASMAAKPGDLLALYANGMGDTTPAVSPGLVNFSASPTTQTPTVTIGNATAEVQYCGLVAAGLYQINIRIPANLTAGSYSIVVVQAGVSSPTGVLLKVATD